MSPAALLDYFAVSVSAVSGVLAARGKSLDLFGVIVLALVTSLGGGTLRDMMVGAGAVAWLHSPALLATVCIAAVVAFFACRKWEPPVTLFQIADALALCAFAVAGTRKGLSLGFDPSVALALGVITGVAGGIIRDTLTGQVPLVFRKDTYFYATAALFGGMVYCLTHETLGDGRASWVATVAAIVLRLGSIRYRLSLPVFESRLHRGEN